MTDQPRRHFLRAAATVAGAGTALSMFPPAIRRALAIPANNATGTIKDVEHVVMVMFENRSFNNYFGTMRGVRGFGDRFTIPLAGNLSVWEQKDKDGNIVLPYRLDESRGNAQRVKGTPHQWRDSQDAWDGGRMNEWARHKTPVAMSYFGEQEVTFQHALADAFTLCDAYHCGIHTGTIANRLFYWTGTNGPTGAGVAVLNNEFNDPNMGPSTDGYTWTTYAERLEASGVSWKVYQNMPDNYGCNEMMAFRQFRRANELAPPNRRVSSDRKVVSPAYDPAIDDPGNPLYKGIGNTMPDGGLLGSLREDVQNNRLPAVSWIIPPETYSEHPGPSSPVQGAWYVQELLDALTANPEVWSKTVLLVNYDENDGYFDHMPSPSAPSLNPDGTPAGKTTLPDSDVAFERFTHPNPPGTVKQPQPDGGVYGPGPRVPMHVISPWSRGGWVASQTFDHTSVLQFLEARFGVMEPNISAYRRAVCGDLTSAFNFKTPNAEALPAMAGRQSRAEADARRAAQQALPQIPVPTNQVLPQQAGGTRPSRALPYVLHTSARVQPDARQVQLLFANGGTAGAVFHVYDKLHLDLLPRRYMVEAGKALDDVWVPQSADGGRYDLWVLGPNGYHRHFRGELAAAGAASVAVPEIQVCYDPAGAALSVKVSNTGAAACEVSIRALAYRTDGPWVLRVAPGAVVEQDWSVADSGQWYDFEVTMTGSETFQRRFAGRVENGRDAVSDPAMGIQS